MATPDRQEITYATFVQGVRLDTQTSETRVVVRTDATKLYCGFIHGILHLIVEDASLRQPGTVPWTNVGSVGWVGAPQVEFVMAPPPPEPTPKTKPPAKTKGAESAA